MTPRTLHPTSSLCRDDGGQPCVASCAALTQRLILLGHPDGALAAYECRSAQPVSRFQHTPSGGGGSGGGACGITSLFPSADGSL